MQFYRNVNTVNVLCDFCNFIDNTIKYLFKYSRLDTLRNHICGKHRDLFFKPIN